MTDPVAARRAAIAAEKERLARARERRASQGKAGATGFAQRKWRWLGVNGGEAVDAVLAMLRDIAEAPTLTDDQRETLDRAIAGTPDRETLLPAVRAGLAALEPQGVLGHLRSLWAVEVRWLNEPGSKRCRILCSTAPGLELVGTRSHAVSGGPAFSLFATAATRGAIPLPNAVLAQVLTWAPLSVLDDLVDHGGLLADDEPWQARDAEEALYLRARLAPNSIGPQEAERLGWHGMLRRRAFLADETIMRQEPEDVWDLLYDVVRDVQLASLDALDAALPRAQQIQLRDLRSGALVGQWDGDTVRDRGLWKLMAALWRPTMTVDPRRSEFYALAALNRAYDLLKSGDLDGARRQAESFTRGWKSGSSLPVGIMDEAYTIAAYATAVTSPEAGNDRAAREQLVLAEAYAEKAAENGDPLAKRNLAHVRTWRATPKNKRGPMTNPFLELGLDHGAEGWERHCRDLFRRYEYEKDQSSQARLNQAEDRIHEAARHESGYDVFFQVPLDRARYELPDTVPRRLVPPLEPMARRTALTSGADLESIRALAAVELLDDFRSSAPHLDRHGSTR
ncbi:hypothetical protein AB0420_24265 [Streptomyces caelestis]|uniref:Uncharacterized protein n=1 Tax=Streptomyces heliomycini TaxID=284032 RepID=A0ABV5LDN4_9ACTN|nr:hypothetical protein [Streptomyces sp. XY152]KOV34707.1 hypothetical protein ADK58_04355 [Streptomyces sp. XY152]